MKKTILMCMLLIATTVAPVFGAPLKVYVGGVTATGVANRDELQATLQTLLASRLNRDAVVTVGSAAEADAVVTGSYVVAGKIFSLDAVAATAGKTLTRAFVQGENQDELIPAVGKLADKLAADLTKVATIPVTPAVQGVDAGDIVKITETTKGNKGTWRSPELPSAMNFLAAGPVRPDGSREVFLADNRHLFHYRQGKALNFVAEKELKVSDKIISLDIIDTGAGGLDLYVSVVRNEQPASQIWRSSGDSLRIVAEGLPYFFRTMSLPGSPKKLYIQKAGNQQIFSGDIFEAELKGADIVVKNQIKLPRQASLYTFGQFADASGSIFTVIISPENKLVVYGRELQEMWKSSEEYGGSEFFLEKRDLFNKGDSDIQQIFINQRIQVTAAGNVLVGKNDALWFLGKKSSLRNGVVYGFAWSGDHLEGKWHTRIAEYYMPDFYYDDDRKELLQLEVTGRPNILSRGSAVLTVRKVE